MSKSIKVSEQVYKNLLEMQRVRQSFSQQIEELITLRRMLDGIAPLIRGSAEFLKWQEEKRDQEKEGR